MDYQRAVPVTGSHREDSAGRLLDEVRRVALKTERSYVRWVEQCIRSHKAAQRFRHPHAMGAA